MAREKSPQKARGGKSPCFKHGEPILVMLDLCGAATKCGERHLAISHLYSKRLCGKGRTSGFSATGIQKSDFQNGNWVKCTCFCRFCPLPPGTPRPVQTALLHQRYAVSRTTPAPRRSVELFPIRVDHRIDHLTTQHALPAGEAE